MNRLAAALTLLAVVALPPIGLVLWIAAHGPWAPPTGVQIRAWLRDPLTEGTVLAGALLAGALLWLLTAGLIVRSVLRGAAARWRRLTRMPLPTPAQATAGSMAGAALLGVPALTITPNNPAPPPTTGTPQHHLPPDVADINPAPAGADPGTVHNAAGVVLPGDGWMPRPTAQAVASMAGLFWLRRRQTYQPTTQRTPHLDDHDLQPLPPTVAAITDALPETDTGTVGTDHSDEPLTFDQLPPGTLTLRGPGAAAAARGMLVTALLANSTNSREHVRVAVRREDLAALLGTPTGHFAPVPGLKLLADENPSPRPINDSDDTGTAEQLRLQLNFHVAHQSQAGTAGPQLADTTGAGLTTVMIGGGGGPPGAASWHVDADGTVAPAFVRQAQRLCVLDSQAASDLITLVRRSSDHTTSSPGTIPASAPNSDDRDGTTPATQTQQPAGARQKLPVQLTLLGGCMLTVHSDRSPSGGPPVCRFWRCWPYTATALPLTS